MYDNIRKFIAETLAKDLSQWLLGKIIDLTLLEPTELQNVIRLWEIPTEAFNVSWRGGRTLDTSSCSPFRPPKPSHQ